MINSFAKELYKNVVSDNMELYAQFFQADPNEEGTIEYWKNAIGFYNKLDEGEKQVLFSIIKSTIVDSVSNVLAIMDGNEGSDDFSVQVKINGYANDSELQDAFLAYVEELEEE